MQKKSGYTSQAPTLLNLNLKWKKEAPRFDASFLLSFLLNNHIYFF